jgi:dCTP deaminase
MKVYWQKNQHKMIGENNPMASMINREKVSQKKKEYWVGHRNEIIGERNPNWKGGISFEPYSPEFTNGVKLSVRQRDRFQCRRCGASESDLGYALSIHHVNYDKKDNRPENFISLCKPCHSKTNFDRTVWQRLFQPTGRILVDWEIKEYSKKLKMIEPFVPEQVKDGVVSWGLSAMGYDIRVTDEFKIFTDVNSSIVDPKAFDPKSFIDFKGDVCIIPPNSFALATTLEYFKIPRKIIGLCIGKSTYARCGIVVNITPLEPEWEGHLTIEISNTTPLPAKIYANEGIAQLLFLESDEVCEVSYADKKGKYQKQKNITLPKVKQTA